jgi:C4-type Zn-finger protein
MKTKYICPSCGGILNVDENIVLIGKNDKGQKGIVLLHTELGNYESHVCASLTPDKGESIDFSCPYCHSNIDYHKEKTDLAMMLSVDNKGRKSKVLFSKIYGEECTYHFDDNAIKTYGEFSKKYMDPEWYLK